LVEYRVKKNSKILFQAAFEEDNLLNKSDCGWWRHLGMLFFKLKVEIYDVENT